ncbi:hypothetical protein EDD21DRAFT_15725 [Dissophora ornata]|nr:hypothetical protein EDD21DRAFT_15725 [Dissophora ornata]
MDHTNTLAGTDPPSQKKKKTRKKKKEPRCILLGYMCSRASWQTGSMILSAAPLLISFPVWADSREVDGKEREPVGVCVCVWHIISGKKCNNQSSRCSGLLFAETLPLPGLHAHRNRNTARTLSFSLRALPHRRNAMCRGQLLSWLPALSSLPGQRRKVRDHPRGSGFVVQGSNSPLLLLQLLLLLLEMQLCLELLLFLQMHLE